MILEIKFNNSYARSAEYYLQRRYGSKAKLARLVKVAITREVADEARKELEKTEKELNGGN